MGRRDEEWDELNMVYARKLIEQITLACPDSGGLLLSISINEHSQELFKAILAQIAEHKMW